MELSNLAKLLFSIDDALRHTDHDRALRLVVANFDRFPDTAPLRERVALVLAENGRKKEAVEILELVGRHYANAGLPTRAIAVAKQLHSLKPDTTNLLDHIATLYNIRSPFLSSDVHRVEIPDGGSVDLEASLDIPEDELLETAAGRSVERRGLAAKPDRLPALPLLSLLPHETFRAVLDHLEYSLFDEVQPVLEKGQSNEALVWTASDDLVLESEDVAMMVPRGSLLGLSSFGRSGRPAEVDVFTQPGSEVIKLGPQGIRMIQESIGDFQNRLATLRRHAMTERILERHPMFRDLLPDDRQDVIETFTGLRVAEGEVIIRQNTPSPGLFLILDGEVDIVRQDDDWEITIATLRSGDIFGEMGLVRDSPTVAGCVMTTAGHLLHLSREEFHHLATRYPAVQQYTSQLAAERDQEEVLSADDLAEVD